jgi:hypothetical protein
MQTTPYHRSEVVHGGSAGCCYGRPVRLLISGDLRSLKDGRARRVLPEWVDDYIQLRASNSEDSWT